MARSELDGMSLKQLLDLQSKLALAIEARREDEREDVKQVVADLVEKRGFSVDELFGSRRRKGRAVRVKYQNRQNPSETWTGRGRKPNWLVAALAKGKKMEDFAV